MEACASILVRELGCRVSIATLACKKIILTNQHKIGTDLKEKSQELDFQVLAIPFCDPPGDRTLDPNIKSVVLYQLS